MAISTIMTFCAGTDRACDVGTITHVHLFKVANNVLTIDIEQGQHYELSRPLAQRKPPGIRTRA